MHFFRPSLKPKPSFTPHHALLYGYGRASDRNDPTSKEDTTNATGISGDAATDANKWEHEGDAERNGYVVMKHAIPESIIAQTHVDESEFEISPSRQYKEFEKGARGSEDCRVFY